MKDNSQGFSLLELLAGMAIVSIGLSAAIPLLRNLRQGEVDRFPHNWRRIFGLRAKLGQQKTSCTLTFQTSGIETFLPPRDLLEVGTNHELLQCCDSEIRGCKFSQDIADAIIGNTNAEIARKNQYLAPDQQLPKLTQQQEQKIYRERSLRLLNREGSADSKKVEVSVNHTNYELTPPGTSTMTSNLLFLIRSTNRTNQNLQTRCLQVSGTGTIFRGSWNTLNSACEN